MQQQKQQKLMLNQKTNKNENQTKQRKLEDYGPYLFWYIYIFSCTLKNHQNHRKPINIEC